METRIRSVTGVFTRLDLIKFFSVPVASISLLGVFSMMWKVSIISVFGTSVAIFVVWIVGCLFLDGGGGQKSDEPKLSGPKLVAVFIKEVVMMMVKNWLRGGRR